MPDSDSQDASADASEDTAPSDPTDSQPANGVEVEDFPEDSSPFLESIRAPISEEAPAGEDVTYDEDFQSLKTQINNIGSVSGQADYERIVELARTVLTEKSKDLRAAGYLVIGEARVNGADRMAEAVRAVRLLIDTYWEDLYPAKRRMRGRGSALQFISDRLADWVSSTDFEQPDRAPLVAARDALKEIQDFGLQEMGEHAPSLSGLLNEFDDVISSLPEPEPDEPSEPAEADHSEPTRDGGPPATEAAPSAPSEFTSASDVSAAVSDAALFLREQDLTDPTPFRLLRAVQWGVLREAPPDDGGETRLQSPREQRRTYLSGLLEDGEYENLVREGESSFQNEPFHLWLDLQRLVASALDALGAPYEAARDAVVFDVARLVRRLPSLPSLAFSDGTPFASPLTVDWIETQVQPMLGGDGQENGAAGSDSQMPVSEQYEEARQLLGGGDLDEALTLMREGAAEDTSEKEAFHRRLYIALLCMKGDRLTVARPLLDRLDADVERHALDSWSPSLALTVWEHKCKCYDALAQNAGRESSEDLSAEADAAFEKICQLDATKGISVAKQRPNY
ncbi:MAG: type VI secretion system protein TssA [Salinibacter sp.]|uniref:type VI secretion system protein TssA n=1 Tax=Salinibacter sp. TaxID=2065818 RepID=UPI0035D42FB8